LKRRKHKRPADDSFELFLDTITNTFGGVLLIALLVVLMIRQSKQDAPQLTASETTENIELVESQIVVLNADKEKLQQELNTLQEFKLDFGTEELAELAQELSEKLKQVSELELESEKTKLEFNQAKSKTSSAETDLENESALYSESVAELEKARKNLDKEKVIRTRTMRLPKEQETEKVEKVVFVESDQIFYFYTSISGSGGEVDKQYVEISTELDADIFYEDIYLKLRKQNGIDVGSLQVEKQLKKYNSSKDFFSFVVRPDSFESFGTLRDICVKNGFEYRIMIVPKGQMIFFGSSKEKTKTQFP
jgi:hypothetical protein